MSNSRPLKKLYYSIGEVAEITDLKPYVLRYWETEFSQLRPSKNRAGNRTYRESDIELLFRIKELLYDDKYTIEGARQQLNKSASEKGEDPQEEIRRLRKTIELLRHELREVLDILNNSES